MHTMMISRVNGNGSLIDVRLLVSVDAGKTYHVVQHPMHGTSITPMIAPRTLGRHTHTAT